MPRYSLNAVLFDLDGTLLDTAPDLAHALNQVLVHHGKKPVAIEHVRQVASYGSPGLLNLAFGIDTFHPDYNHLREQFINEYLQCMYNDTQLFPGMEEVLTTLEARGMRWGIVTNKRYQMSKDLLDRMGLLSRCAVLVGGDSTAQIKPHPDPLLLACEQLGVAPTDCIYIGDAPHDIEAALACNMPSIAAMYGYLAEDAKPEHWGACHYVDKPTDLLNWLDKCCKQSAPES